jgi:hypothetical protein
MSNSPRLLVPARGCARVSFSFTHPIEGWAERRQAHLLVFVAPFGASVAARVRRGACVHLRERTLAFRRSTVAFVGRDPDFAGASAGKPAKAPAAARRTFRLRHCRRIRRSRTSRGERFDPLPQDATPRSAFRIVSGDAPSMSENAYLCSIASRCSQWINTTRIHYMAVSLGETARHLFGRRAA